MYAGAQQKDRATFSDPKLSKFLFSWVEQHEVHQGSPEHDHRDRDLAPSIRFPKDRSSVSKSLELSYFR